MVAEIDKGLFPGCTDKELCHGFSTYRSFFASTINHTSKAFDHHLLTNLINDPKNDLQCFKRRIQRIVLQKESYCAKGKLDGEKQFVWICIWSMGVCSTGEVEGCWGCCICKIFFRTEQWVKERLCKCTLLYHHFVHSAKWSVCSCVYWWVLIHYTILQEPRRPDPVSAVAPFLQIIFSFRIIPVFIAITFIITVAFCQVWLTLRHMVVPFKKESNPIQNLIKRVMRVRV